MQHDGVAGPGIRVGENLGRVSQISKPPETAQGSLAGWAAWLQPLAGVSSVLPGAQRLSHPQPSCALNSCSPRWGLCWVSAGPWAAPRVSMLKFLKKNSLGVLD